MVQALYHNNDYRASHLKPLLSVLMCLFFFSACTCATERTRGEHPGPAGNAPNPSLGRGAPQIDILGYLNNQGASAVVSQSLRVAPFSVGRQVLVGASIQSDAVLNPYTGSATCVLHFLYLKLWFIYLL
jgi:hypothetical protein